MEENPFESLARGLNNRDLRGLLDTEATALNESMWLSRLSVFGNQNLPIFIAHGLEKFLTQQPLGEKALSERFNREIAIFSGANHVVINQFGAFIPQSIFGAETELAYEEKRNQSGAVIITIHPKQATLPAAKRPQFGSARGLIKISDDFDEPLQDFVDYM